MAKKRLLIVLIMLTITSMLVVILYSLNIITFRQTATYSADSPRGKLIKDITTKEANTSIDLEKEPWVQNSIQSIKKNLEQDIDLAKVPNFFSEFLNPPPQRGRNVGDEPFCALSSQTNISKYSFVEIVMNIDVSKLANNQAIISEPAINNGIIYQTITSILAIIDELFLCEYMEDLDRVKKKCYELIDLFAEFAHSVISRNTAFLKSVLKGQDLEVLTSSISKYKGQLKELICTYLLPLRLFLEHNKHLKPFLVEIIVHIAPLFVNLPSYGQFDSKEGDLMNAQKVLYKILMMHGETIPSQMEFNTVKRVLGSTRLDALNLTEIRGSQSPGELRSALLKYRDQMKNALNIATILDIFQGPIQKRLQDVVNILLDAPKFDLSKGIFVLIRSAIVSLDKEFDLQRFIAGIDLLIPSKSPDLKLDLELKSKEFVSYLKEQVFTASTAEGLATSLTSIIDRHLAQALVSKLVSFYSHMHCFVCDIQEADPFYADFRIIRFWDESIGATLNLFVNLLSACTTFKKD